MPSCVGEPCVMRIHYPTLHNDVIPLAVPEVMTSLCNVGGGICLINLSDVISAIDSALIQYQPSPDSILC